jgi:hypothetical protein
VNPLLSESLPGTIIKVLIGLIFGERIKQHSPHSFTPRMLSGGKIEESGNSQNKTLHLLIEAVAHYSLLQTRYWALFASSAVRGVRCILKNSSALFS